MQFYTAIKPMSAEAFFQSYLALPVVIFFYICGWVWKREGWRKLADIDIDSGRRELDWEAYEKVKREKQSWPAWKRILDKMF